MKVALRLRYSEHHVFMDEPAKFLLSVTFSVGGK